MRIGEWTDPQREAESSTIVGELAQPATPQTVDSIAQAGRLAERDPSYTRIYEPLQGDEVIEAIVNHVRRVITNSGKFKDYLIYERAVWTFNLMVQWDAFIDGESRQSGSGEIRGDSSNRDLSKPDDKGEIKLEGTQNNRDMAPDEIREKTNQPIPVIERKAGANSLGASGVIKRVSPSLLKRR